jgi:repressor LexA
MTFGSKLKQIRLSMGLSQEEFAAKLNTTKQVISRYETEQRTPK